MKLFINIFFLLALLSNSSLTLAAPSQATVALVKRYSRIYSNNIAKYEKDFFKKKQRGCIEYIRILKNKQSQLQQSGDLEGWATINNELDRFRETPVVPHVVSSPEILHNIQATYRKHLQSLVKDKNTKIVAFTGQYLKRLESLKTKMTREGNFDDAFLVRDEINRVKHLDKYLHAQHALLSESKTPDTVEKAAPDAQEIPTENIEYADGTIVYYPPGTAPHTAGISYKPVSLSRTKISPWPSSVLPRIATTSEKSSNSRRNGDTIYGTASANIKVRANIRTSKSGTIKHDIYLIVQYYGKSVTGGTTPELIETRRAKIPYLDHHFVNIYFSGVDITSSIRTHRSFSGHRQISDGDGQKFYGYIVSVVDKDNKLLYQAVSRPALNDVARIPDIEAGECYDN